MADGRRARAVQAFSPPEAVSDSYGGMQSVGVRLQVLVGLAGLGVVWLAPGLERGERAQITALLFGYIAYTVAAAWVARQGPTLRLATFATDLAALFSFAFVVPHVRVAIFMAAVLVITFHTHASGRALGFALAAGVALLSAVVELVRVEPDERLNGFTLLICGLLLVVLVLLVDGLSAERRRVASRLARLNRSLTSFTPTDQLLTTLQSAADAAREAVSAIGVTIKVRDHGGVEAAATAGQAGPDGEALTLALGPDEPPIGTLTACRAPGQPFDDDDRTVLAAYAGQVSAVIARSLAFERERAAAARLQETERLQAEFVTTVSHELRTPLTAVSGFVDTVLLRWDDLDDAARKERLERASRNAAELRRLVEQVLEFSTVSAGGRGLVLGPHRLAVVVDRLVENIRPALGDHDIEVKVPPGLRVLADEEALDRIVGNLMVNAAKYSPAGTCISVEAESGPESATVAISDEGPGIPEAERERVFDRFYRAEAASRVRGTGIGLTIVRTYVERLGGTVWVTEADRGKGSKFCFTLPLAEGPELRPR